MDKIIVIGRSTLSCNSTFIEKYFDNIPPSEILEGNPDLYRPRQRYRKNYL